MNQDVLEGFMWDMGSELNTDKNQVKERQRDDISGEQQLNAVSVVTGRENNLVIGSSH